MSIAQFFKGKFKIVFLFIILAELFSLFGYLLPDFRQIAFLVIIFIVLILSLQKLEYGILILLAELFIGSKGYLFYFEYDGMMISIRIALWLIIMAVWLGGVIIGWTGKSINNNKGCFTIGGILRRLAPQDNIIKYYIILFAFIVWGVVNGFLNHNEFSNIFFDFNGWLYFTLIFPIYYAFNKPLRGSGSYLEATKSLLQVFTAAVIWLCFKTFFLLFIFSHNMLGMVYELYRWVRITGVGEITQIQGGFYRIFFQSHIFILIGLFIFLMLLIKKIESRKEKFILFSLPACLPRRHFGQAMFRLRRQAGIACFLSSVVLISFSRSFWIGLVIGLLSYYFIILFIYKLKWKKIFQVTGTLFSIAVISVGLIIAIVKFPYPTPAGGFSTTGLLSERVSQLTGEAAVSSRWALLPKLWTEIKSAPILGQGFGATVTYTTQDPRVLESNPTGEYTTYAFEWGWLDVWLKLGFLGFLFYLFLIIKVCFIGIKKSAKRLFDSASQINNDNIENKVNLGLIIGLIVVSAVSIFSPYMNHPLGIGYLIFVSVLINGCKNKKGLA